jgi:hypothetical protein
MSLEDLAALVELVQRLYLVSHQHPDDPGQRQLQARVYMLPRPKIPVLRQALFSRIANATFDDSDPDCLCINGPRQSCLAPIDISHWRELLKELSRVNCCIMFRITIQGPMFNAHHIRSSGQSNLILYGEPAANGYLLKAIWMHGRDPSPQLLYKITKWPPEDTCLAGLDIYRNTPNETGLLKALNFLRESYFPLFVADEDERNWIRKLRRTTELKDDRSPLRFLIRLFAGLPLLVALGLSLALWRQPVAVLAILVIGTLLSIPAFKMIYKKWKLMHAFYKGMRNSLGKLYSGPIQMKVADHSNDATPTVLKTTSDIFAIGGKMFCDFNVTTPSPKTVGVRVFILDHMFIETTVVRLAAPFVKFPPDPVIVLNTRFTDGRRHGTIWRKAYRKRVNLSVSGQSMNEQGSLQDMIDTHRRAVDRMIASGAVPFTPQTPEEYIALHQQEHMTACENWAKSPYSWADALHEAFGICRREYRV